MRQTTFKISDYDSVAIYPDEMCFAFNPNFIVIDSDLPYFPLLVKLYL